VILPKQLGRYEVLGLLGLGGMGAVYKGRDPSLDRVVALKTISPLLLSTVELQEEYLERFRREARAAARLSHPNIVSVYDLGLDEPTGTPFIVMEYVDGPTLEAVLKETPVLPLPRALEVVSQVAAAVDEAHRSGIVHRDIKPANVFLDERGRAKVGDFGVARLPGSELTQTGLGLGTPGYLAPEVLKGGPADARSDVFALGVLAYRVVTGVKPFLGETREALALEVYQREVPPPESARPEVPPYVSAAIEKAMRKDPEGRTPTAAAFLQELHGSAAPTTPLAAAVPSTVRVPDPVLPTGTIRVATEAVPARRRGPGGWWMVAALLAAGAVGGLVATWRRPASPPSPSAAPVSRPAPVILRPSPSPPPLTEPSRPSATVATPRPDPGLEPEDVLRELGRQAEEKLREELRKAEERREAERKPKGRGRGRGKKHDKDR
jgi:serine/threonine-protein kinase